MSVPPDYQPPARYIEVALLRARNLPKFDSFGKSDPYATVSLGEENEEVEQSTKSFKSSVKLSTLEPEWNESYIFKDDGEEELVVKLYDYNKMAKSELMTVTRIPTSDIQEEESKDGKWYPLTKYKSSKEAGELCLKLERFMDFRELKARAKQFRENVERLQDENASLSVKAKKTVSLQQQVVDLSGEVQRAKESNGALETENDGLEQRVNDLETNLTDATDKLEAVAGELEIEKAKAADDEVHDAAVEKRLQALTKKYQQAESQRNEAAARVDRLKKQLRQAEQQADNEKRRIESLDRKYGDLERSYQALEGRQHTLQGEHRNLQRKYEEVRVPAVPKKQVRKAKKQQSKRPESNSFGEFMTGLGLVFVLFLHRSQKTE